MTVDAGADHFLKMFDDPDHAAAYADGPRRFVPGLDALHCMTGLLLAERVPEDAHILVLGAGGGMELRAMARAFPGWRFTGVDPAKEMLDQAGKALGPDAGRVDLVHGYIDDAPMGPFDGATCLLTLHFLPAAERVRTLGEIRRRLKPGAPFVAAHSSFPQGDGERGRWLSRYAAYAVANGADPAQTEAMRAAVEGDLSLYDPEREEAMLAEAGFTDIALFFAAFTWRGWITAA